ncbi:MAG: hypothetical protein JSW34_02425 [Candidatus Zixiibacteriota bacterium]|nr:MAG: hypothetical protein JSW34_02425 [candidate division Zixibacteria bacterium]
MKTSICEREEEIVAAVISGQMDRSVSEHIETCESCRAAAGMTRMFQVEKESAGDGVVDVRLADIIWSRAALARREKRKRTRRLGLPAGIVSGVAVAILTALVIRPSDAALSAKGVESLLSLSVPLLAPTVLILLAVSLVSFANRANGSMSGSGGRMHISSNRGNN